MNRQTILGAIAALTLAIVPFIAASPAQAACTNVNTSAGYPNGSFVKFCGSGAVQADANAVLGAVAGAPGQALGELRTAFNQRSVSEGTQGPGVQYYIFGTSAQYSAMFPGPVYPVPASTDFGVTYFDSANRPVFTAIFKVNGAGVTNAYIPNTTGYQIGRAINALMGYVMTGGVVTTPYTNIADIAGVFNTQLTKDWQLLNAKAPCVLGGSGVFNGQADPTVGGTVYICDGTNGNGANLTANYTLAHYANNQALLRHLWPGTYTTSEQIVSEVYGYYGGPASTGDLAAQPKSKDIYIKPTAPGFQFACSATFVKEAAYRGALPVHTTGTTDVMPSFCPTVQFANTKCRKLFINTGHFPDGRVADCLPQPNSMSSGVQAHLRGLGGNSDTAPIKLKMDSINQFVYVFGNHNGVTADADFHAAFGSDVAGTNLDVRNGSTFPLALSTTPPTWYSAMNSSSTDNGNSDSKTAYTTAHELGHVVDQNTGQPSQGTVPASAFDKAMQHDWIMLDYISYTSAAVNTPRKSCAINGQNGDTYNGPLLGLTDPINGQLFCGGPGGTMTAFEANFWAGHTVADILDRTVSYVPPTNFMQTREIRYQPSDVMFPHSVGLQSKAGWREWFAQAFAIQAKVDINAAAASNLSMLDQVVQNGYFACTAGLTTGWLHYVYTQQIASVPTCTSSLPAAPWMPYRPTMD